MDLNSGQAMARVVIWMTLLASFGNAATPKAPCDLHAAIGIRLTLPFVFEKVAATDKLVWLHNYTVIHQRDKGTGKSDDITADGSLVLKNPKLSSAGLYQAQVFNASGSLIKSWSSFVCVIEKVPKPTLSYKCDQKSVNFICYTVKSQDLRYSWTMDEKVLAGETRAAVTIPLNKLKSKNSFACGVSNQVSSEISDSVYPVCASQPAPSSQNLLCFPQKTVLAVLAGAVGTVFILVIVIIALCCCRRRNKLPQHSRKEEPRMLALTRREPETDYETMHHVPEMSQEPSPKASPRAEHRESKSYPETVGNSLQPTAPSEGQDPSPVPKPRTKRPNTPDL